MVIRESKDATAQLFRSVAAFAIVGLSAMGCSAKTNSTPDAGNGSSDDAGNSNAQDGGPGADTAASDGSADDGETNGDSSQSAPAASTDGGPANGDSSPSTSEASADDGSSSALRFNGTSAQVTLPTAAGGASETAFSSELWFRTTAATGMLFEVYSSGALGADRSTYLKNGSVCFYVYAPGPSYSELCTTAMTFDDGAWHNVAGTLGSAGQVLYVDGVVLGTAANVTSSTFNYDTGVRLGYGHIGPNGALTYFAGDIDDVRLWSVQRTADELAAGRGHSIDAATPGLQGYWKLDESGSAAMATDSTAAMNDGTLVGFSFSPSPWITPGAF